jgi:hypothetical protein
VQFGQEGPKLLELAGFDLLARELFREGGGHRRGIGRARVLHCRPS